MIDLDNILSLKTILPILGLMLAPILSKTIRSLPSTIIKVLGKHFVTVITFEELNKHAAVERRRIVGTLRLLTWLDEKHPKSAHRRRNLTMRWGKKRLSPMNDIVLWFMYKGMPVRYTSTQMKGEAELDLYVHELLFLSRNDQRVNEFLDEACPDDEFESSVVYDYTTGSRGGMWSHTGHYNKNVKVFLKEELVEKLTSAITHFRDNSEWYVRNGLARKLTILLHGEPGVGKSSVILFLANKLNQQIYRLNLSQVPVGSLTGLINDIPKNTILVIEDFDDTDGIGSRTKVVEGEVVAKGRLSEFLNVFQGIVQLNELVTIFTTNHIEKLDPAIIRSGRIDIAFEIGRMETKQLKEYFEFHYEQTLNDGGIAYVPMIAAKVADAFLQHPHNPEAFKALVLQPVKE